MLSSPFLSKFTAISIISGSSSKVVKSTSNPWKLYVATVRKKAHACITGLHVYWVGIWNVLLNMEDLLLRAWLPFNVGCCIGGGILQEEVCIETWFLLVRVPNAESNPSSSPASSSSWGNLMGISIRWAACTKQVTYHMLIQEYKTNFDLLFIEVMGWPNFPVHKLLKQFLHCTEEINVENWAFLLWFMCINCHIPPNNMDDLNKDVTWRDDVNWILLV